MTSANTAPVREPPKNIYQLISRYYETHPNGHFFDPETLKFFGERRSEMRLLKEKAVIKDACGKSHTCYVVSAVQRPGPPLQPRRKYHYFDVETLEDI